MRSTSKYTITFSVYDTEHESWRTVSKEYAATSYVHAYQQWEEEYSRYHTEYISSEKEEPSDFSDSGITDDEA